MSKHMGRLLDPILETVDHIDGDPLNDSLDNLQLLPLKENQQKSATGRIFVELICPYCKKSFVRQRNQTHLCKGGRPSHCSRRCANLNNVQDRKRI